MRTIGSWLVVPVALLFAWSAHASDVERAIGVCFVISNNGSEPWDSAAHMTELILAGREYLRLYEQLDAIDYQRPGRIIELSNPKHGSLKQQNHQDGVFSYVPKRDFVGTDRLTAIVEVGGLRIRVVQTFHVVNSNVGGPESQKLHCGHKGIYRKLSQPVPSAYNVQYYAAASVARTRPAGPPPGFIV